MSISGLLWQLFAIVLALALAPLLTGWVNQCRAWLQNRSAPPLLQPYYMLHKLFLKDVVLAHGASPIFRFAPFAMFGCMLLACAIIPTLSTDLPFAPAADTIALVGVFGLARIFISLAAMDIGTSFGTLGGRREMLVGFLAEPALLMVIFTMAMIAQSTSVATIVETLAHRDFVIYPSLAFAGIAFTFVSFAENARVPVDNPATHLELTMIHEAVILSPTDFIDTVYDNSPFVELGIRKSCTGSGFPTNNTVLYDAGEQGSQSVEIWARDSSASSF